MSPTVGRTHFPLATWRPPVIHFIFGPAPCETLPINWDLPCHASLGCYVAMAKGLGNFDSDIVPAVDVFRSDGGEFSGR